MPGRTEGIKHLKLEAILGSLDSVPASDILALIDISLAKR